jgi:hypothetical protein
VAKRPRGVSECHLRPARGDHASIEKNNPMISNPGMSAVINTANSLALTNWMSNSEAKPGNLTLRRPARMLARMAYRLRGRSL